MIASQCYLGWTVMAAALLSNSAMKADDVRVWTDSTGKFELEAKLVSVEDGIVLLRATDGRIVKVPLAKLSKADQDYLQPKPAPEASPFVEVTKPKPIDPRTINTLKRKLHGRFAYDKRTSQIILTYDWTSKNQLLDFESTGWQPALAQGGVIVPATRSLQHAVNFREVELTAPVFVQSMRGDLVKTSGGAVASLGGMNPNTMYLSDGKGTRQFVVPDRQRTGIQLVHLSVTPTQLRFAYGDRNKPSRVALPTTDIRAGTVTLCGGELGFRYGTLVLTGTLDEQWVANFTTKKP